MLHYLIQYIPSLFTFRQWKDNFLHKPDSTNSGLHRVEGILQMNPLYSSNSCQPHKHTSPEKNSKKLPNLDLSSTLSRLDRLENLESIENELEESLKPTITLKSGKKKCIAKNIKLMENARTTRQQAKQILLEEEKLMKEIEECRTKQLEAQEETESAFDLALAEAAKQTNDNPTSPNSDRLPQSPKSEPIHPIHVIN